MVRLNFTRTPALFPTMTAYAAKDGKWQFLIIGENGEWTGSHRLINPTEMLSASATMQGPFDSFDEAADAMNTKAAELRMLS